MSGYRFLNRMVQGWQGKPWMRLSDTCPYHIAHAKTQPQLPFVKASLFRLYCSDTRAVHRHRYYRHLGARVRGGSTYRHGKLYKLYWRLHGRDDIQLPE